MNRPKRIILRNVKLGTQVAVRIKPDRWAAGCYHPTYQQMISIRSHLLGDAFNCDDDDYCESGMGGMLGLNDPDGEWGVVSWQADGPRIGRRRRG
jgi:hypothetical protein